MCIECHDSLEGFYINEIVKIKSGHWKNNIGKIISLSCSQYFPSVAFLDLECGENTLQNLNNLLKLENETTGEN